MFLMIFNHSMMKNNNRVNKANKTEAIVKLAVMSIMSLKVAILSK